MRRERTPKLTESSAVFAKIGFMQNNELEMMAQDYTAAGPSYMAFLPSNYCSLANDAHTLR